MAANAGGGTGRKGPITRTAALKKNAKSAHALYRGVNPPSSGKAREGKGLTMPKATPAQRGRANTSKVTKRKVSPQALVAKAHRSGANATAKPVKKMVRKGQATARRRAASAGRSRSSGASRMSTTKKSGGLQNYNVKADNPGGGIGAAFRSFFDIGDFLKGR